VKKLIKFQFLIEPFLLQFFFFSFIRLWTFGRLESNQSDEDEQAEMNERQNDQEHV
jgi:hypothetical protein